MAATGNEVARLSQLKLLYDSISSSDIESGLTNCEIMFINATDAGGNMATLAGMIWDFVSDSGYDVEAFMKSSIGVDGKLYETILSGNVVRTAQDNYGQQYIDFVFGGVAMPNDTYGGTSIFASKSPIVISQWYRLSPTSMQTTTNKSSILTFSNNNLSHANPTQSTFNRILLVRHTSSNTMNLSNVETEINMLVD